MLLPRLFSYKTMQGRGWPSPSIKQSFTHVNTSMADHNSISTEKLVLKSWKGKCETLQLGPGHISWSWQVSQQKWTDNTMFGFNTMSQPWNLASFSVAPWSFNRILIALSLPVPHSWVELLPATLLRSYTLQPRPERFPVVGEMTTCTKVKLQMWESDFLLLGKTLPH